MNAHRFAMFRALQVLAILTMAFSGFGSGSALDSDPLGIEVGIVLPSAYESFEARFNDALQDAGIAGEILFSQDDPGVEKTNVETLISQGIQVLIICPVDASAAGDAVEAAKAVGIKVISFDRLVRDTDAVDFYVTFDGVSVGEAQAQYLVDHAGGTGNPLYLYAGAPWDNNAFLFFEGAWNVLQPKITDGTFAIKNSSVALSLQGNATLTREEIGQIIDEINTNWDYDTAAGLAAANLSAVSNADKGDVFILAPNDGTARAIGDTFAADPYVKSYIITGQDFERESVQYIIYGKQSMSILKDVRTLTSDAVSDAQTFLGGGTPVSTKTYYNGVIDVPADPSAIISADRSNIYSVLENSGYYPVSDFNWNLPWRDEFKGPLAGDWYWVNENTEKWNLTENPGFLRIYASPYGTGGENLLLRPVAPGDFMIKTRLLFEPDTNYQFAGLVIWQDQDHFLQFGRAFCDIEGPCVGDGLYFDKVLGGNNADSNFATSFGNPADIYLRLERRGDMVKAFFSYEGWSWYELGTHWIPSEFQVNAVGLTASQDFFTPDSDIPADFDFFELTEGWGYLPEGFHDFEQGDVPSWACTAGGWAADPDDRAARLNVEIVADDQTVASLVAGDFRQDLLDAGVCEGGNCSFSTSLWGAISSYKPLRVDAWAQDNWTGEWVLLSNSAKTLTCRTYDIYAYNPSTGTTQQITNMRDADEYNPAWSPDGKKVAINVVLSDGSFGSYITTVATGVITPLKGARDGGNDATWSPSGSVIVFDRRWMGDPSLYRVPPTGGTRKLLRKDAESASFSPNGRYLAFNQPSDGSIRTVSFAAPGGKARFIGYGEYPAWSPDGKWIAYQKNGDIWKVQVDTTGAALGGPIQLTHGPYSDERPTWSRDGKSIIYHAGMNRDYDLWSVPAAGGDPTWLTGGIEFGDYDPATSKNTPMVAYASFTPNGQAARQWVSAYTYDAGSWSEGSHSYRFEATWAEGSEILGDMFFNVSSDAPLYDGFALIRPYSVKAGPDCPAVESISPDQRTRFLNGYVTDNAVTYSGAIAYFNSLSATVFWDGGNSEPLVGNEIIPFSGNHLDSWFQYVCSYTAP